MHTESSPASASPSLGHRLRAARLAQSLTVEEVGARLKLSKAVIVAMEFDDHATLGAPVFARGRLGNYARLLGLPAAVVDAQFANRIVAPPPLVSTASDTRFERGLQRIARQGTYVVLTAIIVVPVIWLATHHQLPQSAASLTTLDAPQVPGQAATKPAHAAVETAQHNQAPVAASMAPFGTYRGVGQPDGADAALQIPTPALRAQRLAPTTSAASNAGLQLRFSGDSWIELIAADGRVIERGLVEAGSVRDYPTGAIARVAIGNASSVRLLQNGQALDLQQFKRANGVRFTLSSDGTATPAGD